MTYSRTFLACVIKISCLSLIVSWFSGCHIWNAEGNADKIKPKEINLAQRNIIPQEWKPLFIGLKGYEEDITKVYFVDDEYGWVIGASGIIFHTTNGGKTWIKQQSNTKLQLRDIQFTNRKNGWIFGGDLIEKNTFDRKIHNVLLHTKDGGMSWQKKEIPLPNIYWELNFLDSENGWLLGWETNSFGQSIVAHTTDGGKSWKSYKVPKAEDDSGGASIKTVSFVSPNEGWAAGDLTIRHTTDGGITWNIQYVKPFRSEKYYRFRWVQFVDSQTGWAGGAMSGEMGNFTGIIRTTDGGKTWSESILEQSLNGLHFLNSTTGVGVGYEFVSADLNRQHSSLNSEGIIMLTTDGGSTWKVIKRLPDENLFNLVFAKNGSGWVIGENGAVLHYKP